MSDLLSTFNQHFELVPTITPSLLDEIFRLRYEVLCCQERLPGFEPSKYPDGRETDAYDRRAVHCALLRRDTGALAGCIRLILPDPQDVNQPFPVEQASAKYFEPHRIELARLPRSQTGEISRLIVRKNLAGMRQTAAQNALTFPFPVLGLIAGVVRLAWQHQITHLFAIMEPILNRFLRRFALHFHPVAPVIEHHGMRQAHLALIPDLSLRTHRDRKEVWELLTEAGKYAPLDPSWALASVEPRALFASGS